MSEEPAFFEDPLSDMFSRLYSLETRLMTLERRFRERAMLPERLKQAVNAQARVIEYLDKRMSRAEARKAQRSRPVQKRPVRKGTKRPRPRRRR